MYCESVVVALAGPPPVIFCTSSNNCNVPIVEVIVVNKMIGRKLGIVILKS